MDGYSSFGCCLHSKMGFRKQEAHVFFVFGDVTVTCAYSAPHFSIFTVTFGVFVSAFFVPGSHNHDSQQWTLPLSILQTGSGAGPPWGLWSAEEPACGEHH